MRKRNCDYKQEIKLRHDESAAKINVDTGEITQLAKRQNNIPEGMSKLQYNEFGMLNTELTKILEKYFSNIELSIIFRMINRCDFNTNSLQPLSNETSIRVLAEEFNISVNTVPKVFNRLFSLGVYMELHISENKEDKRYWVLNPYIFWRGRLKKDSIFIHFQNTDITKLLS